MKLRINLFSAIIAAVVLATSSFANAGALSATNVNATIDNMLRGQANAYPVTMYVALGTNTCSVSGSPTEPSTGSYARVAVTSSLANWAGTQSAGSTTASSGTGGQTSNNGVITFPTSTAAWAAGSNLVSVWLMDASTAGNAWACIALTSPVAVTASGVTLSFPAASLSLTIN